MPGATICISKEKNMPIKLINAGEKFKVIHGNKDFMLEMNFEVIKKGSKLYLSMSNLPLVITPVSENSKGYTERLKKTDPASYGRYKQAAKKLGLELGQMVIDNPKRDESVTPFINFPDIELKMFNDDDQLDHDISYYDIFFDPSQFDTWPKDDYSVLESQLDDRIVKYMAEKYNDEISDMVDLFVKRSKAQKRKALMLGGITSALDLKSTYRMVLKKYQTSVSYDEFVRQYAIPVGFDRKKFNREHSFYDTSDAKEGSLAATIFVKEFNGDEKYTGDSVMEGIKNSAFGSIVGSLLKLCSEEEQELGDRLIVKKGQEGHSDTTMARDLVSLFDLADAKATNIMSSVRGGGKKYIVIDPTLLKVVGAAIDRAFTPAHYYSLFIESL